MKIHYAHLAVWMIVLCAILLTSNTTLYAHPAAENSYTHITDVYADIPAPVTPIVDAETATPVTPITHTTVVPPVVPEITYPDIITDIEVKLYNNNKPGFNPIDGAEYCKDIAALLTKYAKPGIRIGAGCAMAYTEGGAGKQGVYSRANNCFGIRANQHWNGWVFSRSTQTVYKDYATAVKYGASDFFRAYPNMEESVKDYIKLIQNNRYGKVLTMDNDYDYLHHIVNQGYGPKHLADDWLWLIKYYNLTQYDIEWPSE